MAMRREKENPEACAKTEGQRAKKKKRRKKEEKRFTSYWSVQLIML